METVITLEASGKLDRLREILRERRPRPGDGVPAERAAFEEAAARMPVAEGVTSSAVDAGGVAAEWLVPPGAHAVPRTILYFHGGGYVLGSVITVRTLVSHLAVAASTKVLSVDYRLAPEHPYPAAVADGVAAYSWLLDAGTDPATLFVGGDSAGGGLTVAVMLALRDRGLPLPAGGFCLSPWVDLTLSGTSLDRNAERDPQIQRWHLSEMAELYLGGEDPRSPLASPIFADLSGLPPLLIHVGTAEALLDDALVLAARARAAGVPVSLEVFEDMIHVWHAFAPGLPEATAGIRRIATWLIDGSSETIR